MSSHHKISWLVVLLSALIGFALTGAAWDMNFWPSDEKAYYYDAAVYLPQMRFLSEIHQGVDADKVRWLHGKEIFILLISWMQRLMHDTETIRPFLVLGAGSAALSSILIYIIALRYWGVAAALVCYAGFTFSVWPYVYVLFAKHQTSGLMLFLLALWLLQTGRGRRQGLGLTLFSGLSLGLSFFTSTVSALYVPFYAAAFLRLFTEARVPVRTLFGRAAVSGMAVLVGFSTVVFYVNWPELGKNIQSYLEYVAISKAYNHFFYNQPALQQWFLNTEAAGARGGWLWVLRYLQVIVPVLLPLYGLTVIFLLSRWNRIGPAARMKTGLMIILSLAPILMAEQVHAAQYGANYFPALTGMVMLLGYGVYLWQREVHGRLTGAGRRAAVGVLCLAGAVHAGVNGWLLMTDVFPTRMATTFLSRKIQSLGTERISTYFLHPHRNFFAPVLNPEVRERLTFNPIRFLPQAGEGYVLVPPITGDTIYLAAISSYNDFDQDVFLNALFDRGRIEDEAVAAFPTMANSRIWRHEEEIISYRDLILRQSFPDDRRKGYVWLLDAGRLAADRSAYQPLPEEITMFQDGTRNIGRATRRLVFTGEILPTQRPTTMKALRVPLYKVGDPRDALRAYLYKLDSGQPVWIPFNGHFISAPLAGTEVAADSAGGGAVFRFDPPLFLPAGSYRFLIYRTGPSSDQDFYRIRRGHLQML